MKTAARIISIVLFLGNGFITLGAQPEASQNKHSFACTDYTGGNVYVISADGKIEWTYPAPNCNDIWVLSDGNLLFNTGNGVKEVTRTKEVVFSYQSKSEIYACQRLSNGNTFIGECNSGRLLEVSPVGKIVKLIKLLPDSVDGGHSFMRNARKLKNGNYLVAHYGLDKVSEYDSTGKAVREFPIKGGPHSVIRLPNGHTLIACSDHNGDPRVVEIDSSGTITWELSKNELPGIELKFMTGMQCPSPAGTSSSQIGWDITSSEKRRMPSR